jgi:hypothetical protein
MSEDEELWVYESTWSGPQVHWIARDKRERPQHDLSDHTCEDAGGDAE